MHLINIIRVFSRREPNAAKRPENTTAALYHQYPPTCPFFSSTSLRGFKFYGLACHEVMVKTARKLCKSDLFKPACRIKADRKNIWKRYPFTGFSTDILRWTFSISHADLLTNLQLQPLPYHNILQLITLGTVLSN